MPLPSNMVMHLFGEIDEVYNNCNLYTNYMGVILYTRKFVILIKIEKTFSKKKKRKKGSQVHI